MSPNAPGFWPTTKMAEGELSNAQYQERLREIQRRRKRELTDKLAILMQHEWGRGLVYWLVFELGKLHSATLDKGIKDGVAAAIHAAHADGRRAMASDILAQVQAMPGPYMQMIHEQIAAREAELSLKARAVNPEEGVE